ncbi:MAG: hypothetical protein RLZ85_572 [Verrucomicrobiota bacterium]|jgi:hypothetical protein
MSKQATDANADFVAALNALENVSANKSNPAFKGSKYVSLDQLLDAVKPVLAKHNLALTQIVRTLPDGRIGVVTSFRHRDGATFDGGDLFIRADGLEPQKIGAALTYIRRQSIQTACCVSVDLDLDGNGLTLSPAVKTSPAASQTPQTIRPSGYLAHPEAAVRVLQRKGWLKEGQGLADLLPEHLTSIANNPAFNAAVQKEASNG